jgi:hypothetical protein
MRPVQFLSLLVSWTFLMAHSKAKLKSNDDKVSPFSDHSG